MTYYVNRRELISVVSYLKGDLHKVNHASEIEWLNKITTIVGETKSEMFSIDFNPRRGEVIIIPSNNTSKSLTGSTSQYNELVIEKFLYLIERADPNCHMKQFNRPIRFNLPIAIRDNYGNIKVV